MKNKITLRGVFSKPKERGVKICDAVIELPLKAEVFILKDRYEFRLLKNPLYKFTFSQGCIFEASLFKTEEPQKRKKSKQKVKKTLKKKTKKVNQ